MAQEEWIVIEPQDGKRRSMAVAHPTGLDAEKHAAVPEAEGRSRVGGGLLERCLDAFHTSA